MPATVTLPTTTLAATVGASDVLVKLASTSGVYPGLCLFVDGELMLVQGLDVDPWVRVKRGVGAGQANGHVSLLTVYIGRPDQFYLIDPVGRPPAVIPVSPYINTRNGTVWFAQGDAFPPNIANRWWQKQTTTYGQTDFGVRTVTTDVSSST